MVGCCRSDIGQLGGGGNGVRHALRCVVVGMASLLCEPCAMLCLLTEDLANVFGHYPLTSSEKVGGAWCWLREA